MPFPIRMTMKGKHCMGLSSFEAELTAIAESAERGAS
jgi:hypothetical protein